MSLDMVHRCVLIEHIILHFAYGGPDQVREETLSQCAICRHHRKALCVIPTDVNARCVVRIDFRFADSQSSRDAKRLTNRMTMPNKLTKGML